MAETGALQLAEADGVICVSGELDLYSTGELAAHCAAGPARVVDLAAVTFIDAAGLHCLLALCAGGHVLRSPSARVLHVARIAGVLLDLAFDE